MRQLRHIFVVWLTVYCFQLFGAKLTLSLHQNCTFFSVEEKKMEWRQQNSVSCADAFNEAQRWIEVQTETVGVPIHLCFSVKRKRVENKQVKLVSVIVITHLRWLWYQTDIFHFSDLSSSTEYCTRELGVYACSCSCLLNAK